MAKQIQTEVKTSTVSTTRAVVGTMLGAVGLAAAMGLMMGYEYASNGNQIFPIEAFDHYPVEEIVIEPERRGLDGSIIPIDAEQAPPILVPIDNFVEARENQRGISSASLVYEVVLEGPITRFYGVWEGVKDNKKSPIYPIDPLGPVRSMRTTIVPWAIPLNPAVLHAGGSDSSLELLDQSELVSIDQTRGDEEYFERNNEIEAPHNLYTNSELVTFAFRDKGFEVFEGDVQGWNFVNEDEELNTFLAVPAERAVIDYSTEEYRAAFEYDEDSQTYRRSTGGEVHIDQNSGEQLSPKNVILQYVSEPKIDKDGRKIYETLGEGRIQYLVDGNVFEGTWVKNSDQERTQYLDIEGNSLQFRTGQTWISVVTPDMLVEVE